MTNAPDKSEMKAAEAEFTDYFVRNYPGPDTIIHDPHWHAPRIFRAAAHAIAASSRPPADQVPELVERMARAIKAELHWVDISGSDYTRAARAAIAALTPTTEQGSTEPTNGDEG